MKTILTRHRNSSIVIPLSTGPYTVTFVDGKSTQPDDIADRLVGLGEVHYVIDTAFDQGVTPGLKVLVKRDTGIGDVLLTTPLVRRLHREGAIVDVMTNDANRWIYDYNPYIRNIYAIEDRDSHPPREEWDAYLDLCMTVENSEARGVQKHRVDAFALCADIQIDPNDRHLDYYPTETELSYGRNFVRDIRLKHPECEKVLCYIWRASHHTRTWSDNTHRRVLSAFSGKKWVSILINGSSLHDVSGLPTSYIEDCSGKLGMRQIAVIMKACDAVICPDTGPFHLAGALDCPTVTYFSTMAIEERHTHTKLITLAARERCLLWPCRNYTCRLNHDEDRQSNCLAIPTERILDAVETITSSIS